MSLIINNYYAATMASNNLGASNANLQKSLNRLSSGSRIVNPADDAGGLAVSLNLSSGAANAGAQVTIFGNQISFLQTQDGVLKVAGNILTRMSQLASLAGDPTMTSAQTGNYGTEFSALTTELSGLASAQFNGQALFGSTVAVGGSMDLSTQTASLTISGAGAIATALAAVASDRAQNGAAQSKLGYDSQVATINQANLTAAASNISDVDVAQESTNLAKWNVLVQYGAAMLAQANQSTQVALKLLQ